LFDLIFNDFPFCGRFPANKRRRKSLTADNSSANAGTTVKMAIRVTPGDRITRLPFYFCDSGNKNYLVSD
jgi:hypothetical protein